MLLVFSMPCLSACSKNVEPKKFALLPAASLVVLAFDDPKTFDDPSVKMFGSEFGSILAGAGLSFASVKDPVIVFMDTSGKETSGACLFHHNNPSGLIAGIKGKVETFLGHEIREIPGPSSTRGPTTPIWWTQIGDTVVCGGTVAVSEIISISEHKVPSLFQSRTEFQSLLISFANSPGVLLLFQRSEDSKIATGAGSLSYLILNSPEGQVFRILSSVRGLAFSLSHEQNGCEQQIGLQFSSYVAATVIKGLGSILPWGPDEIQPESTKVESDGKLVLIHARYRQAQCPRIGLGFQRLPIKIATKTLESYAGRYAFANHQIHRLQRR
jgi:hypothetical protein